MSLLKITLSIVLILSAFGAVATNVESLQNSTERDHQKSKKAQLTINQIDEQKLALIEQVNRLQAEAESLEAYNHYLSRLLLDQDTEKTALQVQIDSVSETRQGLVPLMMSMLDSLQTFIHLDSPMLITERQERIDNLQKMMDKADVSDAEKFRRLLTAYHIEAEYGSKMGQYQGNLTLEGVDRTVNYFYLGRVVFVAVSLDSNNVWLWGRDDNKWLSIDASYARDINKAIAIAKKTDIPALLKLPLLSKVN